MNASNGTSRVGSSQAADARYSILAPCSMIAEVARVAPRAYYGAAQLVGQKLGTWVWQHEGPAVLWGSCLVLGVVVALALVVTAPARRRRMAT